MNETGVRLARIRGQAVPRSHNARTIAALASNPGCARRAVMDAAGADKQRLAGYVGFPAPFGQSRFALARGNAFEAQVKADGAAELLRLLREHLRLPIPEASYDDLSEVGGNASLELRHTRTRNLLARATRAASEAGHLVPGGDAISPAGAASPASGASQRGDAGTMFDHPLLRLEVGGRHAYLEPDLIALALRDALAELGVPPAAVADETILVAVPQACELDDLGYAIVWAMAGLDDALLADDYALDERHRQLRDYEQMPESAVGSQDVARLQLLRRPYPAQPERTGRVSGVLDT